MISNSEYIFKRCILITATISNTTKKLSKYTPPSLPMYVKGVSPAMYPKLPYVQ